MASRMVKILLVATAALLLEPPRADGGASNYPEARSDLQQYQDVSRCYPDVGQWICMYRNYYSDPDFGGASKCLKFQRYGTYENFTTPVVFTFGQNGSTSGKFVLNSSPCYTGRDLHNFTPDDDLVSAFYGNGPLCWTYVPGNHFPLEDFYTIYIDCSSCAVLRHRYVDNGYGCSLWRRVGSLQEPNDCCEFIYAENCGSSPKYQIYDRNTCDF